MLNGRVKGASSNSASGFRPGRLQIRDSSPAQRSRSNVQGAEGKPAPPDIKSFFPLKLSLSPKKKPSASGKQRQISAKPSTDWENQPAVVEQSEVLAKGNQAESSVLSFLKELRKEEEKREIEPVKPTVGTERQGNAPKSAQQQHSNASSKAQLRTSIETALSGLTARVFAQLSTKPPSPEAERVYHTFICLINAVEKGTAPDPFQVTHHKAWKTLRKLAKTPGKLISGAKSVAKAIKTGSFPPNIWPNLMEDLRICGGIKATDDDTANTLSAYMHSLATQYRAVLLDKELTKKSLDYMEVEADSPRRKLLQSLLNRSVEEKDKFVSEQRSSYVPVEVQKSAKDLSPPPTNPFQIALHEGDNAVKPSLRKVDSPAIRLNLAKLSSKSPESQRGAKTTPKTTPRKRVTPVPAEREPTPEVDPQFYALLLDVKFSVFLREKMRVSDYSLPETDSELEALRMDFQTWVKQTDISVSEEVIGKYMGSVDREAVEKCHRKLGEGSSEQTPTWMQMSLRRDKAKLAMGIRPVGKK